MPNLLRWLYFNLAYLGHPRWDTHQSPPELMEFIQSHPAGKALDLGCGTGTNLITLAENGWQVSGFDYSPIAVRIANRRLNFARLPGTVSVADVSNLPTNLGTFDLILDIGCFHNLDVTGKIAYIHQVERLLKDDGTWLLYAHLQSADSKGPGLTDADLSALAERFEIRSRTDGQDGNRSSTWLRIHLRTIEES